MLTVLFDVRDYEDLWVIIETEVLENMFFEFAKTLAEGDVRCWG